MWRNQAFPNHRPNNAISPRHVLNSADSHAFFSHHDVLSPLSVDRFHSAPATSTSLAIHSLYLNCIILSTLVVRNCLPARPFAAGAQHICDICLAYRHNIKIKMDRKNNLQSILMLPWKDSNSHRRNQNPTCYHYTTRQFSTQASLMLSFYGCKGRHNF